MTVRTLTLAEIADGGLFTDGDWVESKDQDPSGGVRLTQLADVGAGEFRDRSDRWLREDQAAGLNCTFLQPQDVLIARMPDPIGRACLVPVDIGRAVTVVDVAVLRIRRPDVLPEYVMWAINSPGFRGRVEALQSGTTRKRISRRNLATLSIEVPSLREQIRIVEIIDGQFTRLAFAEADLESARLRAISLAKSRVWSATHGDHPRVELSSIADVKLGRQRSPKNHQGAQMVRYLRAANVDWNRLRLGDVKLMHFSETERTTFLLHPGDILLTEASGSPAEVGKSCLYEGEPEGVCFQNTLLRVRSHRALPEFLQKYLLAEAMTGQFMGHSRGVGIHHLGRARLASWPIQLPDADRQAAASQEATQALEDTVRLQRQIDSGLKRSAALRRSLLSAAFSGKLTGRACDDEVIEELALAVPMLRG